MTKYFEINCLMLSKQVTQFEDFLLIFPMFGFIFANLTKCENVVFTNVITNRGPFSLCILMLTLQL